MKYFHELTDKEFQTLMKDGITWNHLPQIHPQPEWCQYSNALDGPMGCWSLTTRRVKNKDFCKRCDCYRGAQSKIRND